MKTGELEKLFGVSGTTIRNWVNEFEAFLSPSDTRIRQYTEADILVLATVAKFSQAGFTYPQIRERIQAGERVDHPGESNFGVDTRMIPAAAVEQIIDSTELKIELETIKNERDRLLMLTEKQTEKLESQDQRIEALQNKISELERALGKAEGRLEELDKKPRRWFGG